ncbi:hypothetical protein [Mumia sp. DW29H23]|uniref:hypothetical protein n=1 Tax=Mumia sp. DW29H23 TaxID=3421241 RepID=UPI003D684449
MDAAPRRRWRRRTAVVAVIAALSAVVITATAYALFTAGPRIEDFDGEGSATLATYVAGPSTFSFSLSSLCLESPGRVTVTDVVATSATGGLTVTDFALVAWVPTPGGGSESTITKRRKTLAENLRGRPATTELSATCDDGDEIPELVVQIDKTIAGVARTRGFDVRYRSGGRTHEVHIRYGLVVCEEDGSRCPERA